MDGSAAELDSIAATVAKARAFFATERTLPASARIERLGELEAAIHQHESRIFEALAEDLGRGEVESWGADIGLTLMELKQQRNNLQRWMRPRVRMPFVGFLPAWAQVEAEPLGTALIMAPWNYPFQLSLAPLATAIAAGNTAVVKPSELTPNVSRMVAEVVKTAFGDDGFAAVVQGGPDIAQRLLAERFDVIFFTGSERVGKLVMGAAAQHLTPVVLELGGKSPVYVDASADLGLAARRLVWGKFFNAGQTCIAPDYVLCHQSVKGELLARMQAEVTAMYGSEPRSSPDYARVVNAHHVRRLTGLLAGATVVVGGQVDEAARYVAPTIVTGVDGAHPLMQEEIFGPVLPVLEVGAAEEAIAFIRARPKPLTLYVFSEDARVSSLVLRRTSSGSAMVNDVLWHFASPDVPFGGVGPSGMGRARGQAGFESFSNMKSVTYKFRPDVWLRYPPYTRLAKAVFRWLIGGG